MKCFKQSDFIIIEDNLRQAKFAIEDIINSKPPQVLTIQLRKVLDILEKQIEKDQDGAFNQRCILCGSTKNKKTFSYDPNNPQCKRCGN
tara:strand:+ start:201 stop:467 length:267 start_codon:yes stop_codon:yes gene_type:complete